MPGDAPRHPHLKLGRLPSPRPQASYAFASATFLNSTPSPIETRVLCKSNFPVASSKEPTSNKV
ncbi:MAG: hypothetical protein [Microviridae sp. ctjyu33]|nr:MAG: hypothetical protein [Microviridae sp. ctjyu33]